MGEGRKKNRQAFSLPSPHALPPPFDLPLFWSFNMVLSQGKTFAHPQKMSELQANKTDT